MSAWSVGLAGDAQGEDAERSGPVSESRTFVIEDSLGYLLNRTARLVAHELAESGGPQLLEVQRFPVPRHVFGCAVSSQAMQSLRSTSPWGQSAG